MVMVRHLARLQNSDAESYSLKDAESCELVCGVSVGHVESMLRQPKHHFVRGGE